MLRFRLLLFLALALALLNGALANFNINRLASNERWVSHTNAVLFELERISSLVKDTETGTRGYALTGQKIYLEPYNRARLSLGNLQTLAYLVADNPVQRVRVPEHWPVRWPDAGRLRVAVRARERAERDCRRRG